jgi:lysophospholipase L1-like esterase
VKSLITVIALAALAVTACMAPADPVAQPIGTQPAPSARAEAVATPLERPPRARLVTVGGSFTYGPNVQRRDTWPRQLERMLQPVVPLDLARNLGQIGLTSQGVIDEQLAVIESYQPDLITLQIGANDVAIPAVTMDDYRANVDVILDALVAIVPAHRVLVVTSPDFTLTAWRNRISTRTPEVVEANEILARAAAARGIEVIDIAAISDRVREDGSLLHSNGLDPSEKQYAGWVELIAPRVRAALTEARP